MQFDIHDIEKNEIEIDIIDNVRQYLSNIMLNKIRSNSNAYIELKNLISTLDKKELKCKNIIEKNLASSKNNMSHLKIETKILKDFFLLKKELECTSVHEVMCLLLDYYNYDKYLITLSKIETCEISENFKKNLINSKFNICKNKNFKNKIVYSIDDIEINENIEYLKLKNFKLHSKNESESYLFSQNFTLMDLDDFFNILFK